MKRGVIVLEKEIYYSVSVIKLILGWVGFGLVWYVRKNQLEKGCSSKEIMKTRTILSLRFSSE